MEYNITYRQKDKGWQFIISYKLNGKWKQKSKQGFKTKRESKPVAEKMVLQLKKDVKNNVINANNTDNVTFKYIADIYLEHIKLYREPSSIRFYTTTIKAFSELNEISVDRITKGNIQKVVDAFIKRNLKRSTIDNYLLTLKRILKYYKENFNPSYNINLNKLTLPKEKENTKRALTKKELANTLEHFKKKTKMPYQYIICLLASTCGLRFGEIMGLTWSDVNEIDCTLSVNKQWKRNREGVWDFGTLKTKNSKRIVPIPPNTLAELKRYKLENPTDIKNRIIVKDFEVCRVTLNLNLNAFVNISIHELRHTYATFLISNGIDIKTAAQLLGHDVRETLRTYSHVTNDMFNNASEKISKMF